ncbi:hypothetical protein BBBOND_0204200 [Babesia bigemina]|uniref:Uncharacterized protein n=1 Tax=Babesia bigemina TaxID=5866 RepID=A0A061D5F2_BABBI|nr:hypothetical protein BBBOND_0204200 [Babesia bigemina]CDR95262.1 hypothetical protein BBBOND_0204200 [Babesia bigemina]|eukprot:XP_012767448.1 hypothetical protein BBBOND_0204200 [Babesia bigemina]
MVFHSLTDAPRDFREGIDWLVALKGTDFKNNLKAISDAVYNFLADKPVGSSKLPIFKYVTLITKEFLEQDGLKDHKPVKLMLTRFNSPKDEKPNVCAMLLKADGDRDHTQIADEWRLNAKNIAENLAKTVNGCEKFLQNVRIPHQYESAYSSEATWEKSCSEKPEDCAAVFVGIAPMLYTGLMSLLHSTDDSLFRLAPDMAKKKLETLLNTLRYVKPECRAIMGPSDVAQVLSVVDHDALATLGELSNFWTYHGLDSAGVAEALKYYHSKYGSYPITGGDNGVNMGLVNAWNSKLAKKPAKTGNALGSDNIYYPGVPTVANLNAASPI